MLSKHRYLSLSYIYLSLSYIYTHTHTQLKSYITNVTSNIFITHIVNSIHPQAHIPGLVTERLESDVELAEGEKAPPLSLSLSSSSPSSSSSSLWSRACGEA